LLPLDPTRLSVPSIFELKKLGKKIEKSFVFYLRPKRPPKKKKKRRETKIGENKDGAFRVMKAEGRCV
jgi:hypothetical protein